MLQPQPLYFYMKSLDNALYEDNHIFAAHKPKGIATQPDFVEICKAWLKKKYKKPGRVFLEPIHRLDKAVSGIVLFAKTSKALTRLQKEMREKKIHKTYRATVEGVLMKKEGKLTHFLIHDEYRARVDKTGKESILHYTLLTQKKDRAEVEIILETGRYHQIRAQFAAIGHPVVGDQKYGSKMKFPEGILLSHVRIEFTHPVTQEWVIIHSKI